MLRAAAVDAKKRRHDRCNRDERQECGKYRRGRPSPPEAELVHKAHMIFCIRERYHNKYSYQI